ncbi:unnamed protein product [Echinostoma caproni]|uniref:Cytochrome b5 heme-binding domain-containing protein n=1 Tax=Echinostoma caproni TaxID=27848 RepID=A0A183A6D4_9TREM|nr:unnamed protein product [Echinostoma caproni]
MLEGCRGAEEAFGVCYYRGKLILLSSLVVGIAIGLRLSVKSWQPGSLTTILDALILFGSDWIFRWNLTTNRQTTPFKGIDPDADFDPHLRPPSCLRYPFHVDLLEENVHLSLLGYVFKIPPSDSIFGPHGSYTTYTGYDATYRFLGENSQLRYALDGVETRGLADLLRWFQFLSSRYQCVGHLPGLYFDPMGDPTAYTKSIFTTWEHMIEDQITMLVTFPRCQQMRDFDTELTYVTCPDEIKPNGKELISRYPRLLVELSRRAPRCACVSTGLANPPTNLLPYPQCDPSLTRCQSVPS